MLKNMLMFLLGIILGASLTFGLFVVRFMENGNDIGSYYSEGEGLSSFSQLDYDPPDIGTSGDGLLVKYRGPSKQDESGRDQMECTHNLLENMEKERVVPPASKGDWNPPEPLQSLPGMMLPFPDERDLIVPPSQLHDASFKWRVSARRGSGTLFSNSGQVPRATCPIAWIEETSYQWERFAWNLGDDTAERGRKLINHAGDLLSVGRLGATPTSMKLLLADEANQVWRLSSRAKDFELLMEVNREDEYCRLKIGFLALRQKRRHAVPAF